MLFSIAAIVAGGIHVLDPAGFFHNTDVIRQIAYSHNPLSRESISASKIVKPTSSIFIVDARTPPQYESSRIPNSVNLPISDGYRKNKMKIANVSFGTPIIIYCNSADCPWAQALANSALFQDYESVFILEDGIEGYKAAGGTLEYGHSRSFKK